MDAHEVGHGEGADRTITTNGITTSYAPARLRLDYSP